MAINTSNPKVPTLDRGMPAQGGQQKQAARHETNPEHMEWLQLARDSYSASVDYFEASIQKGVQDAYASFRSTHPQGSRYYHSAYKFREKIFVPKTRAAIDDRVAAAAQAFFATQDVVSITPINPNNHDHQVSADILMALVDLRLEVSVPWFQTVMAAYQDADTTGTVISKQYWEYKGEGYAKDKPCVKIYPIEAVHFDSAADFMDPINTSPYLIIDEPMYLSDVREMQDNTPHVDWIDVSDEQLSSVVFHHDQQEATRREREGRERTDSKNESSDTIDEYRLLDIREYIVTKDGKEWVFWTAGNTYLLSEPKPLKEVYLHNVRPFAMGHTDIEAHRIYPAGLPAKSAGSQERINRISNLRLDNWALAVNKRWLIRRNSTTNFAALRDAVPGGGVEVDDPQNDIREIPVSDVSGSAYQEQEVANQEFDSISGTITHDTVRGNRNSPQGAGNMNLLSDMANIKTEYALRMFAETWVTPVIRQLILLEQKYETDKTILDVAASRANLLGNYGIAKITAKMLEGDHLIRLNVGFGATTPNQRIARIAMALQTIGQFSPAAVEALDSRQIIYEVMGALGWRDGSRFFPALSEGSEDYIDPIQAQARIQELEGQLQEMQGQMQTKQAEMQTKMQIEQMRQQGAIQREAARYQSHLQITEIRAQLQRDIAAMKAQSQLIQQRVAQEKNDIKREELQMQLQELQHEMNARGIELLQAELDREREDLANVIQARG